LIDWQSAKNMYHGEKFNSVTHLVGAVLALAGAIVLVVLAALGGDPWKVVGVAIYGVTLVMLYSFSALYHSLQGRAKNILRELDHQSIYLLIAGSYTPFCLVTLRGAWGWSLLGIVWGLAALGSLQELRPKNEARVLSVVIYLLMGWVALVALFPLLAGAGTGRVRLADGWRTFLHRRNRLLRARHPGYPRARGLAPVRARRQRHPLHRDTDLRAVTGGLLPRACFRVCHQDVRACASVPTNHGFETIMVQSELVGRALPRRLFNRHHGRESYENAIDDTLDYGACVRSERRIESGQQGRAETRRAVHVLRGFQSANGSDGRTHEAHAGAAREDGERDNSGSTSEANE
jgi:hemolysin III